MKIWYKFLFLPILIFALAGCGKDDEDDDIIVVNNGDETTSGLYHSLDMTTDDGKVTQLLKHKVGKGVPIVIMGDGFVDRAIKDGKYREATISALDALFSVHPLKSLRDYFDVYEVTAVSYNYGYDVLQAMTEDTSNFKTAFSTVGVEEIGNQAYSSKINLGDQTKILEYAKKAVNENSIDDATIIMLVNDITSGGITYYNTHLLTDEYKDVPTGCSIVYVSLEDIMKPSDDSPFKYVVTSNYDDILQTRFVKTFLHEFGHGFAKLADEYTSEKKEWNDLESGKEDLMLYQSNGYNRNVSVYSDVTKTYWADFAADSRYDFEKLGCYEGGYYQTKGVYRPTDNSVMNLHYFSSYFNVISRVMIYKRCMNIAYGDNWKFDYDDFVKFDLEKAKAEYQADQERNPLNSTSKRFCAPPRFVEGRDSHVPPM